MSFPDEPRGRRQPPRAARRHVTPGRVVALASLLAVAVVVGVILLSSIRGPRATSSIHSATTSAGNSRRGTSTSAAAAPRNESVPILVYHVINAQPAGSSANPALYVPTDQFTSQMHALKAAGWHAVTLNQLEAYWTRGVSLGPGKPIVLSFDNGYASQATNALPVLKQLGWVGVENLEVTGLAPSDGGLTDAQIRSLIAAGWELDTQGLTHADLVNVGPTQLTDEVASARQTLHSRYSVPVNWFSYPGGDYNAAVIAAVRTAGYLGATTVNPGWASPQQDRFRLPRLVVAAGTTPTQLLAQIAAAKGTTSIPSTYTQPGVA
jgi:peptidoglycan/xylan/chitin deacetylase (PgdA/CDA1 family)